MSSLYGRLRSGSKIPLVGMGTWRSPAAEVTHAVKAAIDAGYRHIDCAYIYGSEKGVGEGLTNAYKAHRGGLKREDMFITSKLWSTHHHPDDVEFYCREGIANLQSDYLDLYLLHWPYAFKRGPELFPLKSDGTMDDVDIDYLDTYKAMESLVDKGLCKDIGVSNFNINQLTRLVQNSRIKPSAVQVECHPYLNQSALLSFCQRHGMALEAYAPLGSPDRPWAAATRDPLTPLLQHPAIERIARRYGKSVAQVLIRFQVQRGVAVLPKSVKPDRLRENLDVYDFHLNEEAMATLVGLNCNRRFVAPLIKNNAGELVPRGGNNKHYPFRDDGTVLVE